MDAINTIYDRMASFGDSPALYWEGREVSYTKFLELEDQVYHQLKQHCIGCGTVCGVLGEFCPLSCALLLALMRIGAISVPLTKANQHDIDNFGKIAGLEHLITVKYLEQELTFSTVGPHSSNDLVAQFRQAKRPGLIVFTSGSSGVPKGILHDCERVMLKFIKPRPGWRTVLFLLMDHFGGFNTFLSAFAYGGTAVCVSDRTPEKICQVIQSARVTLLPTTPTFLNLLLISGLHRSYDLSSVQLITYGTEVMPDATLAKLRNVFPNAQLKQTYGLSELGVLRSRSENDNSLWVKIGGSGFEVKVVDGILWVRSEANMVGYLNAPSPFDSDGWMCTGDQVEMRGEFMRILGRKSELINVGGQKVFPSEIESVLLEAPNVKEATVFGVSHPIMGQVAHAKIALENPEDSQTVAERLRKHCFSKLAKFKVPVKFHFVSADEQRNQRFKKVRSNSDSILDVGKAG